MTIAFMEGKYVDHNVDALDYGICQFDLKRWTTQIDEKY
jgi:hypothetical protein